ncbi:MAG: SDR family NAD(P)-dependent oxidoreductase, partial [Actinobacteria bacterium]|nr:SDR family NAD(P)-dependent oxidoreductase [Actinomycetota bacterium]
MGRAMARRFAAEGARVAAADIVADRAAATAAELRDAGAEAEAFEVDVAAADSVAAAVEGALASFGRIDLLCSNAGILDDYHAVLETSEEEWDRVLSINLKGMYLTARAVLPQMIDNGGGVIVNTASIAGLVAGGGGAAYTAAKHGVIGLTRQLSFDYGPRGVRANAICPGA